MTLLGIKLKQTQQLNQRLQQSLRVLQMSGIELEREVENWLSDNPLLERKDTDEFSDARFSHYTAPARQIGGDEGEDMLSNIAGEQDFKQYLHAQVCEHPLSDQEAACVHILIDFLDEQGYLTDSIEDILDHTPLEWMLDEAMLKQALTALKKFDPAGVAAADLNESLILQIERSGECAAKPSALHIVRNALDSIDGNRSQTLARIKNTCPKPTAAHSKPHSTSLLRSIPFPPLVLPRPHPRRILTRRSPTCWLSAAWRFLAAPLPNTENPLRFRQHTNAKPQNNCRIIL